MMSSNVNSTSEKEDDDEQEEQEAAAVASGVVVAAQNAVESTAKSAATTTTTNRTVFPRQTMIHHHLPTMIPYIPPKKKKTSTTKSKKRKERVDESSFLFQRQQQQDASWKNDYCPRSWQHLTGAQHLLACELPGGFPPELAFRALAAYSFVRTMSLELRLSPFTSNAFLRALNLPAPSRLLGQVHVSLLRILLLSLQMGYSHRTKGGTTATTKRRKLADGTQQRWPLRAGDNLTYLDCYTWPLFFDDYIHLTADALSEQIYSAESFIDFRTLSMQYFDAESCNNNYTNNNNKTVHVADQEDVNVMDVEQIIMKGGGNARTGKPRGPSFLRGRNLRGTRRPRKVIQPLQEDSDDAKSDTSYEGPGDDEEEEDEDDDEVEYVRRGRPPKRSKQPPLPKKQSAKRKATTIQRVRKRQKISNEASINNKNNNNATPTPAIPKPINNMPKEAPKTVATVPVPTKTTATPFGASVPNPLEPKPKVVPPVAKATPVAATQFHHVPNPLQPNTLPASIPAPSTPVQPTQPNVHRPPLVSNPLVMPPTAVLPWSLSLPVGTAAAAMIHPALFPSMTPQHQHQQQSPTQPAWHPLYYMPPQPRPSFPLSPLKQAQQQQPKEQQTQEKKQQSGNQPQTQQQQKDQPPTHQTKEPPAKKVKPKPPPVPRFRVKKPKQDSGDFTVSDGIADSIEAFLNANHGKRKQQQQSKEKTSDDKKNESLQQGESKTVSGNVRGDKPDTEQTEHVEKQQKQDENNESLQLGESKAMSENVTGDKLDVDQKEQQKQDEKESPVSVGSSAQLGKDATMTTTNNHDANQEQEKKTDSSAQEASGATKNVAQQASAKGNAKKEADAADRIKRDWPQFEPVYLMRQGCPYHRLSIAKKLDILEFLIDEILSVDFIAAEISRRHLTNQCFGAKFAPLPTAQELGDIENADECAICGIEGDLLCCDGCPRSYHHRCMGMDENFDLGDGEWLCPECDIVDPARFGSLRGGSKAVIDWFSIEEIKAINTTNVSTNEATPMKLDDDEKSDDNDERPSSGDSALVPKSEKNLDSVPFSDSEFLIVQGFVFQRQRAGSDFVFDTEPKLNDFVNASKCCAPCSQTEVFGMLSNVGQEVCDQWPITQVPINRALVWSDTMNEGRSPHSQSISNFVSRRKWFDPSTYDSLYHMAPLPKAYRGGSGAKQLQLVHADYETECNPADAANSYSTYFTGDFSCDAALKRALRLGSRLFNPRSMVTTYLEKLENTLYRARLLHESWGLHSQKLGSSVWIQNVRTCESVSRLSRLAVALVDATQPLAFFEEWLLPTGGGSGRPKPGSQLPFITDGDGKTLIPVTGDWIPDLEKRKRKWEDCTPFTFRSLLAREKSSINELFGGQQSSRRTSSDRKRKRQFVKRLISPSVTGNGISQANTSTEGVTENHDNGGDGKQDKTEGMVGEAKSTRAEGQPNQKLLNAKNVSIGYGAQGKQALLKSLDCKYEQQKKKATTEENQIQTNERPRKSRARPRRSRRSRGGDVGNEIRALSPTNPSLASFSDVVDELKTTRIRGFVGVMDGPHFKESGWPIAGRELFDPVGYLPPREMRRLARNAGCVHAPFMKYSNSFEVGQAAVYHVWRKQGLRCRSFEELILQMRTLESFLDKNVIQACETAGRRYNGSASLAKVVKFSQRSLATGQLCHYLFNSGRRRGAWVTCNKVEPAPFVIDRVQRVTKMREAHDRLAGERKKIKNLFFRPKPQKVPPKTESSCPVPAAVSSASESSSGVPKAVVTSEQSLERQPGSALGREWKIEIQKLLMCHESAVLSLLVTCAKHGSNPRSNLHALRSSTLQKLQNLNKERMDAISTLSYHNMQKLVTESECKAQNKYVRLTSRAPNDQQGMDNAGVQSMTASTLPFAATPPQTTIGPTRINDMQQRNIAANAIPSSNLSTAGGMSVTPVPQFANTSRLHQIQQQQQQQQQSVVDRRLSRSSPNPMQLMDPHTQLKLLEEQQANRRLQIQAAAARTGTSSSSNHAFNPMALNGQSLNRNRMNLARTTAQFEHRRHSLQEDARRSRLLFQQRQLSQRVYAQQQQQQQQQQAQQEAALASLGGHAYFQQNSAHAGHIAAGAFSRQFHSPAGQQQQQHQQSLLALQNSQMQIAAHNVNSGMQMPASAGNALAFGQLGVSMGQGMPAVSNHRSGQSHDFFDMEPRPLEEMNEPRDGFGGYGNNNSNQWM